MATAIALYSTSVEDLDTVAYFLVFQEMGDPLSVTKYPVNDRLDSAQAPQSEPQNP